MAIAFPFLDTYLRQNFSPVGHEAACFRGDFVVSGVRNVGRAGSRYAHCQVRGAARTRVSLQILRKSVC